MISLLLGFLSSTLPAVLAFFKDKSDKAQEVTLLRLQLESLDRQALHQLDIAELQSSAQTLIATQQTDAVNLGRTHSWVNDINGLIRPAGAVFSFWVVGAVVYGALTGDTSIADKILGVPLIADTVMFIIGYWYGHRSYTRRT